jgi:hypothetical protein
MSRILVLDYGNFLQQSIFLAEAGHEVLYYTAWEEAFPKFQRYLIGQGLENENFKKVMYPFFEIDNVDYIVNWDCVGQDIIEYLRNKGYKCFGAGKAALLENHREMGKLFLQKLGLPVMPWVMIKGLTALKEYLKQHRNKVVKIDTFRGDIDSFKAKDYQSVAPLLEQRIPQVLGAAAEDINFIVESDVSTDDSVEIGSDVFFNGTKFLTPYCQGYEIDKAFYIGRFVDKLPAVTQNTLDKLTPAFQKLNYRGAFSTEEIVVSKNKSYLIDFCTRLAAPLSVAYPIVIQNFDEVVLGCAEGEDVEIEPIAEYWGVLPLESSAARELYLSIDIPDEYKYNIVPYIYLKRNNTIYSVPPIETIVVLIAWGSSVKEVFKKLQQLIDIPRAYGLETSVLGYFRKAEEEIKRGEKFGIFFR